MERLILLLVPSLNDWRAPSQGSKKRNAPGPILKVQRPRKKVGVTARVEVRRNTALRPAVLQECTVCMDAKELSSFPSRDELPRDCFHDGFICKACIGASIASDIENKSFTDIGCPRCQASWPRYYLELYSTEEVMMRYETIGMLRVVKAMPNFRWCLSPTCKSGQIYQAGDGEPIMTCVACGFKMCFTHQIAWHSGVTCAQYDAPSESRSDTKARTAREECETAAKVKASTKPCPRCGIRIQKNGGCEHMTCES